MMPTGLQDILLKTMQEEVLKGLRVIYQMEEAIQALRAHHEVLLPTPGSNDRQRDHLSNTETMAGLPVALMCGDRHKGQLAIPLSNDQVVILIIPDPIDQTVVRIPGNHMEVRLEIQIPGIPTAGLREIQMPINHMVDHLGIPAFVAPQEVPMRVNPLAIDRASSGRLAEHRAVRVPDDQEVQTVAEAEEDIDLPLFLFL